MLTRSQIMPRLVGRMLRTSMPVYRFSDQTKSVQQLEQKHENSINSQDSNIGLIEKVLEQQLQERNTINSMYLQKKLIDTQILSSNPFPGVQTQLNNMSIYGHSFLGTASFAALIAQLYLGTVSLAIMLPTAALVAYGFVKTKKLTKQPEFYTITHIEKGVDQLRLDCIGLGMRKSVVVPINFLEKSATEDTLKTKSTDFMRALPYGHYFDSPAGLLYLPVNNGVVELKNNEIWKL